MATPSVAGMLRAVWLSVSFVLTITNQSCIIDSTVAIGCLNVISKLAVVESLALAMTPLAQNTICLIAFKLSSHSERK